MGGQGGAKKLKRSAPTVAAGEAKKTPTKAKPAKALPSPASKAAPDTPGSAPETLDMAVDEETSAGITKAIRKQKSVKGASSSSAGAVIYLGHIPHGFYEEQMKGFFSQFGNVSRIHLARNKKVRPVRSRPARRGSPALRGP